ncbi:CorA family divalent cation transporter [Fluviicola taffensis]|uniref:Mg2 transporter protein CorA family protein n=1 Tax=Fluviicola taffensis (strain DSM 16823 / NCIMB 13979 / RW262) TaxID=755732 RepID=F2IF22_FLUTR|nr:CorA family divalent cation transporter [Fluviicola taffensis]AEA42487.1 Mg2 transporter protein CorA family protein [Fluviicola taffensis DSM 16823]
MIELYTKNGKLHKLESIQNMTDEQMDFISIRFYDYKEEDLNWVKSNFNIDLSIMNHVEDIEISSHFQENDYQSSFHFSLPQYKQKNLMVEESLFVVLTEERVFGFFNSSLGDYFTDIYGHKFDSRMNTLYQVEDLFKFLIEFLSDYYADITENIAKRIKQLASRVLVKKEFMEDDLDTITQLNFNNILIKESLNEFRRILRLHKKGVRESKSSVKDKIDEELNDLAVVSDYIQFNFDRLDDLKENISNKIELEQNKIFKLLTMVTFCISMPTLIAGIYGMNFQNMPELATKYGYLFALIAMLLSVVIPLVYFKRKKWL